MSLDGNTLTYSFTPGTIDAGTAVSIEITGMTNTGFPGSYASAIETDDAGITVDSGTTPAVSFLLGLLNPQWTVSDTAPWGGGRRLHVHVHHRVHVGPGLGDDDGARGDRRVAGGGHGHARGAGGWGSVSLSGTTLTYSFTPTLVGATPVSIEITGLTNTTTAGSYTSDITTVSDGRPMSQGTTPAVTFSGATLVSPEWTVSDTAPGGRAWTTRTRSPPRPRRSWIR